jgi:hypothetical protein
MPHADIRAAKIAENGRTVSRPGIVICGTLTPRRSGRPNLPGNQIFAHYSKTSALAGVLFYQNKGGKIIL